MEETRAWLDQGERDLRLAGAAMREELYDRCLVCCQQAVEKALKALYIKRLLKAPPRTHDVSSLAEEVGVPGLAPVLLDLTRWYMAGRYPDSPEAREAETPTRQDAEKALEAAARFLQQMEEEANA